MPVCKNGQGTDGYRMYINRTSQIRNGRNYKVTVVKFMCDNRLHRTDGPASIGWDDDFQNIREVYCVRGKVVNEERFKRILGLKKRNLPLLINHQETIVEIAKDKMNNRTTQVRMKHSPELDEILKFINVQNIKRRNPTTYGGKSCKSIHLKALA